MRDRFTLEPLQNRIKEELMPERDPMLKITGALLPILIYNLAGQIVIVLFAYFVQWVSGQEGTLLHVAEWMRTNSMLLSGVVKGVSLIAGAGVVYSLFVKEKPVLSMPVEHKKDIGILFFLGASAALAVNILFSLTGFTESVASYEQVAKQQFAFPLWAGIVLFGVISPVAEEIVFRGIVYNRLRRNYTLNIALIYSAIFFGLYHGNVVQGVYGFLLGLLMAVMYEKYGSFLVPVILHGAANIAVYVVTSGNVLQIAGEKKNLSELCMNLPALLVCGFVFVILLAMCMSKRNTDTTENNM